jgi:hypothetical protein
VTYKSYREESRANWGTTGDTINLEQLKAGAVLRIADACELMAKDRQRMERDLQWNTERHEHYRREAERLARSNAALRGVIKRMKRSAKP